MRATPLATRIYTQEKYFRGRELGDPELGETGLRFGFCVKIGGQGTLGQISWGARGDPVWPLIFTSAATSAGTQ